MAYCEVTVNDIYNKVSKEITSTFPNYKVREDGNLFIPEDIGNRNFLGSQLQKTVAGINKEYLSYRHGNVVNVYKEPYGYIMDISPKQELADAMTAQNYRDEVGDDFYMGDDALREQNEFNSPHSIDYTLRAVNILQSDKAKEVFAKGNKNNWTLDKILTELQIPKEQKQLILDLGFKILTNNDARVIGEPSLREQIILELVSNYSYTVEINTAKEKLQDYEMVDETGEGDFQPQEFIPDTVLITEEDENGNVIGVKEVLSEEGKKQIEERENRRKPTQHYSDLTVPGGTNYTENEISTPLITPSIIGHAQFSTDKGIGWFRSDDKKDENLDKKLQDLQDSHIRNEISYDEYIKKAKDLGINNIEKYGEDVSKPTKTRRILEVQSDLFQKGRNQETIAINKGDKKFTYSWIIKENPYGSGFVILDNDNDIQGGPYKTREEAQERINRFKDTNGNQFLQLLNKDNNWVTFFVKSIIQDSAKKGYEEVLFPKGDTAAKIEGHETLEGFKKQTEDRIKKLKSEKFGIPGEYGMLAVFETEEEAIDYVEAYDLMQGYDTIDNSSEIEALEQELANVESGQTQLSSIAKFYEDTVTNILKKQGYNPVEITDEYGNTWSEIKITPQQEETIFLSPHSRINTEEQNSQEPISDNFVEYVQYKKQQLDNTKQDINRVKQDLRSKDTSTNRAKLKRLEEIQRNIENQLEQLGNNEVDYMFHAIDQDLDNLAEALSSSNLHEVDDVREKIEFYEQFFDSLVKMNHPSFAKLKEKSTNLKVDYGTLIKGKVIKMLENSPLVQKVIDNYKKEGKEITIEDLLKANADISWWDENLYGIISSSTGDTILPQFLFSEFNKELRRETEGVQDLIDKLNAFLRRTGMQSFSWVQSETDGKKDGYLIDLFSNKWFSTWKERNRLLQNFRENLFSGADSKVLTNSYKKLINWHENNTHFVDFTRLRIVKDMYGSNPEYSKYFTSSDEQMIAYEENLKKQLGPRYEDTVEMVINKLQKFDELKFDVEEDGFKNRNIASSNIWEFLNQSKNRDNLNNEYKRLVTAITKSRKGSPEQKALIARQSEVLRLLSKPAGTIEYEYVAPDGLTKSSTVLFNKFDDLSILPKSTKMEEGEEVDSGFYSKEFQDMLADPEKVEYWSILKEMSDYINSTYAQDPFNRLSYPKVEQEYAERLLNDIEFIRNNPTSLKGFGRLFGSMAHEYKSWFFEKGRSQNDESGIRSNYNDKSESEIRHKATVYQVKGMSKEDAYKRARAEVVESYSDIDLNTSMKAALIEASLHNARLKTEPIAKGILKVFSDIKDKNGKDRTKANERLKYWVDKIVLNHTTAYRGSTNLEGKPISNEGWLNKIIQQLGGNKWLEKIQERKLMKLLSDNDKKILKELKDVQKSGYGPTFKIDHLGYKLQKVVDADGNSQYAANGEEVTKEEFDKVFEQYIEDHIKSLGLDLNLAGIVDGVLKTVIFKGLGLNPISGIFNRIEGKHSSMIMDLTGEYWTTGNIDIANQFMFAANINKMSPDQLPVNIRGRRKEVKTFQEFINRLRVLQDRKNELQRNVEDSRFSMQKLNLFQFAVEHPEFKNQGAIMLAIMMDEDIVDNNGNKFKLFDKDTMSFTPFALDEYGVLKIKPEFSESFTFNSEQIENMVLRIEDAVSHSQGNYNQFDIMKIKKSMWGRAATVFMTWFPEHFNQRWGVRDMNGDLNVNLFTGKKRQDGRFIAAYKTSKPSFFMYMLGALGISYGALGMVGLIGAGAVGAFVYQKFLKKVTSDIGRDANHAKESVEFFRSILVETLNYPMRMANTSYRPGDVVEKLTGGEVYSKTNLSDEQIGSLRAMARELAIMLTWLSIKLAMGALLYDDDDDKDSPARMRYNFVQNQLSRFITTLNSWGNPHALVEDNSRIAALSYLGSLWKFLDTTILDTDMKNIPKAALDITPIPRIITKPLQGQAPWEDKTNYDNDPNINLKGLTPTLKWTETLYKDWDTEGEYTAKKEYNDTRNERRDEIKKDLMSKYGSNKNVIKAIADIKMEQEFGKKQKDMTYAEALDIIEDGEAIPKQKTKSGKVSKTNFRVKLRKKLRALGLPQEKIDEIIENELGN